MSSLDSTSSLTSPGDTPPNAVAVVGMAGRFPGAPDVEAFWSLIWEGREGVSFFTADELLAGGTDPALVVDPDYVPASGILEGVDSFDASFFGYTPREADLLDPQQRLFLESAWAALEDAGYRPDACPPQTGVFAAAGFPSYLLGLAAPDRSLSFEALLANDKDFLAPRVSYKLGLGGPSVTVQTACSSSLVAVHLACQSLLSGECDLVLAGGARVHLFRPEGYLHVEGGVLSPDGRCRPFDADARGSVPGDGVAVVVLRRLTDALADGLPVRAVILGSAVNNDGAAKVGFTAPSVGAQAAVIAEALAVAGVEAASIGYLEAHGTGTPLGDPIELAALKQAFGPAPAGPWCALGSVKANIGHLDAAAGVAGVVKAVLCVERGLVPPLRHFRRPNPEGELVGSPFFAPIAASAWPGPEPARGGGAAGLSNRAAGPRRRAGVSSFGMGGTNVHVVLEQAPPTATPDVVSPAMCGTTDRRWHLAPVSARTADALRDLAARLAARLESPETPTLGDATYTLQVGRKPLAHRLAVAALDAAGLAWGLRRLGPASPGGPYDGPPPDDDPPPGEPLVLAGVAGPEPPRVAYLFPGQGAQYPGMGAGLYTSEPVFREEVDRVAALFEPHLGFDVGRCVREADPSGEAAERLGHTDIAQPALFAVEMALARLWQSWGVRPAAMVGHSLGELTAATLAGVFDLEAAAALVAARGRLAQARPAGAMLSVFLPEEAVRSELGRRPELSLAAVNAPDLCTVSGPTEAVAALEESLVGRQVECRRLPVSRAFHSPVMEPAAREFREEVARAKPRPPQVPYLANLTGDWIRPEQATDPGFWAAHLLEPVRFGASAGRLLDDPRVLCLEVGPGRTLGTIVRRIAERGGQAGARVVFSLRHPHDQQPDEAFLAGALGRLWVAGVEVNWASYQHGRDRRRVSLPTYPFERRRYWLSATGGFAGGGAASGELAGAGAADGGPATGNSAAEAAAAPANGQPKDPRPDLPTPHLPPRNDLERGIALVWEEVLGLEGLGVNDDLFELGGHSLIATRIAARLRQVYPVDLPLRAVFETATIARLARVIEDLLLRKLEEMPDQGPEDTEEGTR